MPPISRYMTTHPLTIDAGATLREAHRVMHANAIRHLPVCREGRLVGVVSDRDLHVLEGHGVELGGISVAYAMTERPFVVTGDTPVDEVVEIMGEKKYGSVIVMGHDGIEGIFTATDACQVLAEVLRAATA